MSDVVEFPKIKEKLTFDELSDLVMRRKGLVEGVLVAFQENGNICFLNFGDMTAMKALWLAEQLKEHALYADYDLDEDEDESSDQL